MKEPRISIGSNLRGERFELEVSVRGKFLSRAVVTFYLVDGIPMAVFDGCQVPWNVLREKVDHFFEEWAGHWDDDEENSVEP